MLFLALANRKSETGDAHIACAFFFDFVVSYETADFGGAGVNCAEAEDVEEDETAVIDEVLYRPAGKAEVCVCELRDACDAVYAVDIWQYAVKREVGGYG